MSSPSAEPVEPVEPTEPGEPARPAEPAGLPAAFGPLLASGRLPDWLPPVLATLHAGYAGTEEADSRAASRWAHRLAALLGELDPPLPLAVVHDWQARTVVPMLAATAEEPAAVAGLQDLHARAAAGERFGEADWRAALEPVLRGLYRQAYGYAEAYATAHASASAYARANDFSEQGAVSFADSYAASSTDSNRNSFADSNAAANAAVLAAAYASGDPRAYAEAYPFALVQACAYAWANTAGPASAGDRPVDPIRPAPTDGRPVEPARPAPAPGRPVEPIRLRQQAYARLADGLADSCAAFAG